MDDIGIVAEGLTKRFGDRLAVDAVDLWIPAGSVYALLGPNGAGKTTTVRMLVGLLAPSGGTARVAGLPVRQDERSLSLLHRRVGLLTESPGMWDRLSCAYNLKVYARLYGMPDPDASVRRALALVGLGDRRDDPVARLSKGMRQRLAISRALLHEPPVLFLDEPTSGLDPEASAEVRELIARLRGEGRSVLICTHNLDEAERLADRLGVFRRRLLAQGTADELRRELAEPEILVRVRPPDRAGLHLPALEELPGVSGASARGEEILVRTACPEEVLPGIVRTLVEDRAQILHVGERRRPLEEVYRAVLDRAGD